MIKERVKRGEDQERRGRVGIGKEEMRWVGARAVGPRREAAL